jgi:hypothetical protein
MAYVLVWGFTSTAIYIFRGIVYQVSNVPDARKKQGEKRNVPNWEER